jgi:hypothetical protein
MNDGSLQERIYRVLELISESPCISQRDLASSTGLSLGLINLTLKRLIQTGHIKVFSLNRRKVEYILTPKGLIEKAHRTYAYVSKTVKTFMEYQGRLEQLIRDLVGQDCARFAILGDSEIVPLVIISLRSAAPAVPFRVLHEGEAPDHGEIVLDCRLQGQKGEFGISILARLLKPLPPGNFPWTTPS